MKKKIAIIGECMVELQHKNGALQQSFGGDTLNTALYFSRLCKAQDIETSYVTALGEDPYSRAMLDAWKEEGIDTSLIHQIPGKQPGIYHIETDSTGERSFYYWRNEASAKFMFDQDNAHELLAKLKQFDVIYLSGITLAILTDTSRGMLFELLDSFSGQVFFDNNFRPKLWQDRNEAQKVYLKMLSYTDTALLTFDDEEALYGDEDVEQCIARTKDAGVSEVIVKRGSKDCLVYDGETRASVAANQVKNVVDTTAAGDSFSAGFLAKRLSGGSGTQSAEAGHIVASTVIQHKGAIIPRDAMPDLYL
ncbi:sugar kinase [Vibrio sp. Isolate31]|uniref:sugar kinase n=1 Tax=unclassified Vibrio TaxID=2614977 RepID=UPI001EFD4659|nr:MULTISPECIES: sugar kinase [unclassified Vibrio]MCG9552025.1 sugar kinase [Vibrio sp. Isolate32]MCG9602956.1 sugar kinase [Vibrio sp. Isolate31]